MNKFNLCNLFLIYQIFYLMRNVLERMQRFLLEDKCFVNGYF